MAQFDCEILRDGILAQPVNSLSALAFVVVALALWRRGMPDVAIFAGATGAGSVWFHASPSGAASWVHDITLYGLIAISAIELWHLVAARRPPVFAIGLFAVGVFFWSIGRTGGPFCEPSALLQWHAVWHVLAAGATLLLFAERRPIAPS